MSDPAEVKALLRKLTEKPFSIAFAPGEKSGELYLEVHKSRSPRQLGDDLRDSSGSKQVCYGSVRTDAGGETMVVVVEGGKSIPSLETKLQKYLREEKMPFKSVRLDEGGAPPSPAANPAETGDGPGFSFLGF